MYIYLFVYGFDIKKTHNQQERILKKHFKEEKVICCFEF